VETKWKLQFMFGAVGKSDQSGRRFGAGAVSGQWDAERRWIRIRESS